MNNEKYEISIVCCYYNEINILINTIRKWWIEDSYELGLNKCMNKIDSLVVN